jgi:hypothetical protein
MKVSVFPILVSIILTVGCSQSGNAADVPDNPQAKATQALVEQYIHAITSYDPAALESLFSEDYVYSDFGRFIRTETRGNIIYMLTEEMSLRDYKAEIYTYTITSDGRFAVLQYLYSEIQPSTGNWAAAPVYNVLEFKDGKINRESLYYNSENYH